MLSSSLISSGTKLTRLYSSNRLATEALRRRNRGPVLADKLHSRNRQTVQQSLLPQLCWAGSKGHTRPLSKVCWGFESHSTGHGGRAQPFNA